MTLIEIENTIDLARTLESLAQATKLWNVRQDIEYGLLDETISADDYRLAIELIDAALSQN